MSSLASTPDKSQTKSGYLDLYSLDARAAAKGFQVYRNGMLIFLLSEKKTIVCTRLQVFSIAYHHANYGRQLHTLRELIKSGDISKPSDLVDYCSLRPGHGSMMYGLEMVPAKLEWYI